MVKGSYEKGVMQFITQQKVKRSISNHAMTIGVKRRDGREPADSS